MRVRFWPTKRPRAETPRLQTNGDARRRDDRSETSEFLRGIELSECFSPHPALLKFTKRLQVISAYMSGQRARQDEKRAAIVDKKARVPRYCVIMRLPPLNPLLAFEAAGRLKSIRRAAEELAVTPGAVCGDEL
jgi:hypothetical protein